LTPLEGAADTTLGAEEIPSHEKSSNAVTGRSGTKVFLHFTQHRGGGQRQRMKVLRNNRLLVTLVFAAVVLTFGSSATLAATRLLDTASGSFSVSQVDRPAATPSSGEPDVGGYVPPTNKSMRPVAPAWDPFIDDSWRTWISRIWASWSLRVVR
jgi:hypothetical protein